MSFYESDMRLDKCRGVLLVGVSMDFGLGSQEGGLRDPGTPGSLF